MDLGNYDECVNINQEITSSQRVTGKYCFADVPIGSLLLGSSELDVKTAVCFPSSCSAANMDTLLRGFLNQLLGQELSEDIQMVDETSCRISEQNSFDGLTIFTIVILSVMALLVLLATLYDYFVDTKELPALIGVFSARASTRSLFRLGEGKPNPNVIDCLHGMRCMSLIWVIFFHEYMINFSLPNQNSDYILEWYKTLFSSIFTKGTFSVDTFFFITGLLLVFGGMRTLEKSKGKVNVLMMYLHRYLRLTPVVAFAILIYMRILPLLGDGPFYTGYFEDYNENCQKTWYMTLLYVHNYATKDLCLSHTWYLAADMQLYVVSVPLLIALYKWGKKAVIGIMVLIILLAICLFCEIAFAQYSIHDRTTFTLVYYASHTQASPYFIGLLFGYLLHFNRGKSFELHRLIICLGWLISLGLLLTCVFSLSAYDGIDKVLPYLEDAFHLTLARIAWPLGLCWIVFACMQGYGGPANSFLTSPLWQPLSKLSYCTYIFHMFFVALNMGITRTSTVFSDYNVMLRFWGDFGFSILLSYLIYILVEVPFGNLETLLLPTRKTAKVEGPRQN
ncbi:nose resistant to fluoxetine protein 6 [Drosophila willistoni]|nr:nose resistant to fluoxetine protein 6 [Drosophila willistoni]